MNETPADRLRTLGIELPELPTPLGSYVPCVETAQGLIYISGMLPLMGGALTHRGKVGADLTPEDANEAARVAAINGIAALSAHLGGPERLDMVRRCVRITGHVASAPGFTGQPGVMNGASDLMAQVFGEAGRHSRAALGALVLPMDAPVEIEMIFELHPGCRSSDCDSL